MEIAQLLRTRVKAARRRRATWIRLLDVVRLLPTAEGRARLWTRFRYGGEVHQTTPQTFDERYPALFDLAVSLAPAAARILSFGCSTGEELIALRRRFERAEIVGVEINPRSRAIARRRVAADPRTAVVAPNAMTGSFDVIFALAVLQREPHKIAEMGVTDLSRHYPFARFDAAVRDLVGRLREGGLLCVAHTHYRVEDSTVADRLAPVSQSALLDEPLFGADNRRLDGITGRTIFRKT
jgi:methyltransferase family protein